MFEAIYMAATGLTNQQKRLDTIADNIANSNTVGFKTTRLDFKDALYTAGYGPAPAYTADGNLQKGHGVMIASINKDFNTGNITVTENELDFCLEGDAFFQVVDHAGQILYTRAGNFYKSVEEDGNYLVTSQGYYVLNSDGQRIQIPDNVASIGSSDTGVLNFVTSDGEISAEAFGLYTFTNRTGLLVTGGSNYQETAASGAPIEASNPKLRQGALEASNVSLAQEMTRMIRTQRAFQLASRALTTADSMEGIANNMRG